MNAARPSPARVAHRQRGVATILILLLLGLAIGVAVLGMTVSLRGTQQRQLTTHAATAAQGAAWRGVEAIRTALLQLPQDRYEHWADGQGWDRLDSAPAVAAAAKITAAAADDAGAGTGTGEYACEGAPARGAIAIDGAGPIGVSRAVLSEVCRLPGEGSYRVTAQVTGRAAEGTAASTSTVEVVYLLTVAGGSGPGNGGGSNEIGAINIYRDLVVTGGIEFRGENADINVDGNVVLDNASVTGISSIRATGSVTIGSGIQVDAVYANGDVTLTGSSGVSQVYALGDVRVEGGAKPLTIRSGGTVTFAGGSGEVVEARRGVVVAAGGVRIASIATEGDVRWTGAGGGVGSLRANGSVEYAGGNRSPTTLAAGGDVVVKGEGVSAVHANGTVRLEGYGTTGQVQAGGTIVLTGSAGAGALASRGDVRLEGSGSVSSVHASGSLHVGGWQSVGSGVVGGALLKQQQYNSSVNVVVQPGYQAAVSAVAPVSLAALPEVTIPRTRVDVYPLKLAANYVFEYVGGRIQVTVAYVDGIASGTYVLGERYADHNRYPDYLCRPEHMSGTTCTQPVAAICQGFSAQNGCFAYDNGKWTVNGQSMARGVAWFDGDLELGNGTYVNTFLATGNIVTAGGHRTMAPNWAGYARTCANAPLTVGGASNAGFAGQAPTNLCDLAEGTLIGAALGNAAFVAGGYLPGTETFVGGRISLGASTHVSGNVSAGDTLLTGGSTRIDGAILAAAQAGGSERAAIGGSTVIDYTTGDDAYHPGEPPCMADCDGGGTETTQAQVLWSRYL
ncbi:hypothetical protein [Luteimonas huabeiensis]|uniref:hypothetical protein n=1 Tax=Luteimonas huabeiensis TaxID=1244513 RepID=UPI0004653C32|nr:hypothetical protein [Luteimonas huabeiensis]